MKARINEIFSSIQGEGPVVGYKQLFIRFCGCNLNCEYCDTEFAKGVEYSPQELFEKITKEYNLKTFHSVSLTGGEPLLSADFLTEFLPLIKNKVKMYLETNATMPENLLRVKPYIDIISADIKLKSSTGLDVMKLHEKFFENCNGVDTFAKIVFDTDITEDEISKCCNLSEKYCVPLVLQPKMVENKMSVSSEFCEEVLEKFTAKCRNVRLIPQVHKFLNVR
jgi:organic radical activating enzyme